MKTDYEKFATENMGVFRIGSVNCNDFPQICNNEKVDSFPLVRLYPQFPAPTQDFKIDGQFDPLALKKTASRFYVDKSIEITSNNHQTFIEEDPGRPKVLMFTKAKKGTPFVIKALSSNFEKTLDFGIIREGEDALAKKYKIKNFPSMVVVKSEGKPLIYDSEDFTYKALFEYLNVHSQIFVDPNASDNTPKEKAASKPWLTLAVPELNADSGNDVCLKKDGTLCGVLVCSDKSQAEDMRLEILNSLGQGFAAKISRGIQFNFMWVDASKNPEFVSTFGLEVSDMPKLVILNPGKRKRFLTHEGDISEASIS